MREPQSQVINDIHNYVSDCCYAKISAEGNFTLTWFKCKSCGQKCGVINLQRRHNDTKEPLKRITNG
jgi:hypothetical protein